MLRRRRRTAPRKPLLRINQILAWADAHRRRTNDWPYADSGIVRDAPCETWQRVDDALRAGRRGLPKGSSLARLLAEFRGVPNPKGRPRLTHRQILAWADAYHRRTGQWPGKKSGRIAEAPGETWGSVYSAMAGSIRGLPGGSQRVSFTQLISRERGIRHPTRPPQLTYRQILAWADAHYRRTGRWPTTTGGAIHDVPGETWQNVSAVLGKGLRGLPAGLSLAKLLAKRRGYRNRLALPSLTFGQVLDWADAHRRRTSTWPHENAGPVIDAPGETWSGVASAMLTGGRGLSRPCSLARLLVERRGARSPGYAPKLTVSGILTWADAHFWRSGEWPRRSSGAIAVAPGETWRNIDAALSQGLRGLPCGSSLCRLLLRHRGATWANRPGPQRALRARYVRGYRSKLHKPSLRIDRILTWADAHHRRIGTWPKKGSGPIVDAPDETWLAIDTALRAGIRGLPGHSSLPQLLAERRGVRNVRRLPPFTIKQILTWADAHHRRTGRWPLSDAGPIASAPGESWTAVDIALVHGRRGQPGGSSLARLLDAHGRARNRLNVPRLSRSDIIARAKAHRRRTGQWPHQNSGAIPESPGDTWARINDALRVGKRGLPGGSSLPRLLSERLGVRNRKRPGPLSPQQIVGWARAYRVRTGRWPNSSSGPIPEAPGEHWRAIYAALSSGHRGLKQGTQLTDLLKSDLKSSHRAAVAST